MPKYLTIPFYVLFGAAIILVALWGHLTTDQALLLTGISTALAYLALLSLVLREDRDALLVLMIKSVISFIFRTLRRAIASIVIVSCVCGFLSWKILTLRLGVEIVVSPSTSISLHQLSNNSFSISLVKAYEPPDAVDRVVEYTRKVNEPLRISFPRRQKDAIIRFTITHSGYESTQIAETIERLASSPRKVDPVPRPLLVVTVRGSHTETGTLRSYRVSASPAGAKADPKKRTLTLEGSPPKGSTTFIATNQEDWYVEIQESRQNGRIHYSPAIFVNNRRKSYTVDLASAAIQWKEPGVDVPPEPARLLLSENVLLVSHGDIPYNEIPDGFLFGGAPSPGPVLIRKGYVVSYNPKLKIPNWVGYRLHKRPEAPRPSRVRLRPDPNLDPKISAETRDYTFSRLRYDAGNLVSRVDMRRVGEDAVRATYFLSNVAPQTPMLNRGVWQRLERMAREYVDATGQSIYIMAGPAFVKPTSGTLEDQRVIRTIGNGVAIPTHFFRLHVRLIDDAPDVLAFLVPNDSDLEREPEKYLSSFRDVENVTNLEFFRELPAEQRPDANYIPVAMWSTP